MHGVGGAPHPDYLLGLDSLDNFRARGLTSRQWTGWIVYLRNFPSPMKRADINSALGRQMQIAMTPGVKNTPKLEKLIPQYGKQRKELTPEQIREIRTWSVDLGEHF